MKDNHNQCMWTNMCNKKTLCCHFCSTSKCDNRCYDDHTKCIYLVDENYHKNKLESRLTESISKSKVEQNTKPYEIIDMVFENILTPVKPCYSGYAKVLESELVLLPETILTRNDISLSANMKKIKQMLIDDKCTTPVKEGLKLTKAVKFKSVNTASSLVSGQYSEAAYFWKDSQGKLLKYLFS